MFYDFKSYFLDLEVTNNGRFIHEKGFITTILTVRNLKLNTEQTVYHHQWKNWPDRGVPENYGLF